MTTPAISLTTNLMKNLQIYGVVSCSDCGNSRNAGSGSSLSSATCDVSYSSFLKDWLKVVLFDVDLQHLVIGGSNNSNSSSSRSSVFFSVCLYVSVYTCFFIYLCVALCVMLTANLLQHVHCKLMANKI